MFKTLLNKLTAGALMLCLFSVLALAQDATTTQVRFAKGKSSAEYTGKISKTEGVQHYQFTAKAGQRLRAAVTAPGDNVKLMVYPYGSASQMNEDGDSADVELGDDGKYVITVQSTKGAANYKLTILIQ